MSYKRQRSRRRSNAPDKEGITMEKRTNSEIPVRSWLDMPADIMLLIFTKLGVVEILVNAQNVCSCWRKLAKQPLLYRALDLQGVQFYVPGLSQRVKLALEAVDRSCGQLINVSTSEGIRGWDDILLYINSNNSLRSFQIREGALMSENTLAEVAGGFHSIEELDICFCSFPYSAIDVIGRTCQKLVSFRLQLQILWLMSENSDEEVSIIVRNMPQLRSLSLVGFVLTDKGLQTILDGCPLLKHLDLQRSFCDKVYDDLLKTRASKIGNVMPPGLSDGNPTPIPARTQRRRQPNPIPVRTQRTRQPNRNLRDFYL